MRICNIGLFLILFIGNLQAENNQTQFTEKNKKSLKIPFRLMNNTPVIPVSINGSDSLFLILDTGLGTTLITELTSEDNVELNYASKLLLKGLGEDNPLEAIQAFKNRISIGSIHITSEPINVLAHDIFNLSEVYGTKINGIIGYSVFKNLIVEIDYKKKKIIFHNPRYYNYKSKRKGVQLPLSFINKKPFINIFTIISSGKKIPVKLLIDTGASLALWLSEQSNDQIIIPEKNISALIGQGLNGNIYGKIARIDRLEIGTYTLKNIVTSFPDSTSVRWMLQNESRNGSIGGEVLKRFKVIIDYPNQKVSFIRNSNFWIVLNTI